MNPSCLLLILTILSWSCNQKVLGMSSYARWGGRCFVKEKYLDIIFLIDGFDYNLHVYVSSGSILSCMYFLRRNIFLHFRHILLDQSVKPCDVCLSYVSWDYPFEYKTHRNIDRQIVDFRGNSRATPKRLYSAKRK